jgi:hypothetical protein
VHQSKQSGQSSEEPAEGRDDIPTPEQGSPNDEPERESGEAENKIEKGEVKDVNPLAPPVNTQAGS